MYQFIYKQIPPKSNYFWLFFASHLTIFLYCFYTWDCDLFRVRLHRAYSTLPLFSCQNFKKPIFGTFQAKYLSKYLSVRRMLYIIQIVSSGQIFEKKVTTCQHKIFSSRFPHTPCTLPEIHWLTFN